MDHMKRVGGVAKGSSMIPARKDEDESLVLFGELYRHDQEKDVNLLEPMYSVEFEAIQGHGRLFKLPSGKRDFFLPDGEKHDYDWLKTPPRTPLFPSLEMEANSSQMVFQKELPILQPIKTSRFSRKPEAPSASSRSESPTTSSSSKSVTPTASASSSSKKNLIRGAPTFTKEETSSYRIDKRSSYTPLANRQNNALPGAKKTSGRKPAVLGSTNAVVKKVAKLEIPDKLPKNIPAGAPRIRSKDPSAGAKDLKVGVGNGGATKRMSCPPAPTMGIGNREIKAAVTRGRGRAEGEPAAQVAEATVVKGRRREGGDKEQRQQKLESHGKKLVG